MAQGTHPMQKSNVDVHLLVGGLRKADSPKWTNGDQYSLKMFVFDRKV